MKLLLIGATGSTGSLVAEKALTRGHTVNALVRSDKLQPKPGLTLLQGDVRQSADLVRALTGCEAVISCLGQNSSADAHSLTQATAVALEAMRQTGVKRYLTLSGALLSPTRNPILLVMRGFLKSRLSDATAMETLLSQSDAAWTVARPPNLKQGAPSAGYQAEGGKFPGRWAGLPLSDLADFLLDEAETPRFGQKIVGVGPARQKSSAALHAQPAS